MDDDGRRTTTGGGGTPAATPCDEQLRADGVRSATGVEADLRGGKSS